MNNIYQPYANLTGYMQPFTPTPMYEEIKRVNGMEGAKNYRMAPNASALLMDTTQDRIFMVTADAGGMTTVTPLTVAVEVPEAPADTKDILARLERLEVKVNEYAAKHSKPTEPDAE